MRKSFKSHKSKASEETRDARRTEAKKDIDTAVKSLLEELQAGKTERLVEWMQFCSQFHRYSTANQWLISEQARRRGFHASQVASYNGWQELGNKLHGKPYQVVKGEKALWIWAPRPYVRSAENKETHEEEEKVYTGFVLVPVFDASQVAQGIDPETGQEHPPMQKFFTPLPSTEESQSLFEALKSVAQSEGFTVKRMERRDGVQGYSSEKIVMVREGLDSTSAFSTLVHEYTHGVLHQGVDISPRDRECEAEATAYIVLSHFGLHNPFSSDYLLSYGNTEKELIARLEGIRKMAHAIIEKLHKHLNGESELVENAA